MSSLKKENELLKRENIFLKKEISILKNKLEKNIAPAGSYLQHALNYGRWFTVNKSKSLDYTIGDRVEHIRFGEGMVRDIAEGDKDFEVEVEFDGCGIKRMFASFAKLKKID